VTDQTLRRARAGSEDAFRELTDPYRCELQLHLYPIVGSVQEAEDLLQETLLAAWRSLERFEERASIRAWLYRIATNRSSDAPRARRRRPQEVRIMSTAPKATRRTEPNWLEAYPDALLEGIPDDAPGPEALRGQRGDRAGIHRRSSASAPAPAHGARSPRRPRLPRGGDRPETLDTTEASINSLLRRAHRVINSRLPTRERARVPLPDARHERESLGRLADAFETGDTAGVLAPADR
jgi:RNA polymerase sigma factor (sigma-70 family)